MQSDSPSAVIKSGGYKISALDVEAEVSSHPQVSEAIVVGVDDEEFGQRIAAAVVLQRVSSPFPAQSYLYWPGQLEHLADFLLASVFRHLDPGGTPRVAQITTVELQIAVDAPSRPGAREDTHLQGPQGVDQEGVVRVWTS